MALYRCAACGSPNVVTDTQKEGYDFVKGAVGTIVLGVGGAAAGVNGKTKKVFKCAACGLTLSYAMPQSLKIAIDIGVASVDARAHLTVDGTPVFWDYLTEKYPNIEQGTACVEAEKSSQEDAEQDVSGATIQRLKYADYFKAHHDDIIKYRELIKPVYERKHRVWELETEKIQSLRQKEFDSIISSETEKRIQSRETAYASAVGTHSAERAACEKNKAEAEATLAKLGVFEVGKKMEAKKTIKEMVAQVAAADEQLRLAEQAYQNDKDTFDSWLADRKKQVLDEIDAAHPLPEEPEIPFVLIPDEVMRKAAQKRVNGNLFMEILNNMVAGQVYTQQQIFDYVIALREDSITRITALLNTLVRQGFLECVEETKNNYYYLADFDI